MKIYLPRLVTPTVVYGTVALTSAAQTITTATDTPVEWDTVIEDNYGFFDLGSDDTIATIPAGIDRVTILGQTNWTSNSGGRRQTEIWYNGAVMSPNPAQTTLATANTHTHIVQIHHFPVSEGDTFLINCWHNRGSDTTIRANANAWCYFKVIASHFSSGD